MGDESSVRKGIVLFADGYIPGILLRVDSESNLAQPPHSLDAKPGPSGFVARPASRAFLQFVCLPPAGSSQHPAHSPQPRLWGPLRLRYLPAARLSGFLSLSFYTGASC